MDTGPELSPQPASMHTDSETSLQLAQKHTDLEPGTQLPPEMHNDPKPELLAVPLHSDAEPVQATVQEEKLPMSAQKPGRSLFQRGLDYTALIHFLSLFFFISKFYFPLFPSVPPGNLHCFITILITSCYCKDKPRDVTLLMYMKWSTEAAAYMIEN